MTFKTAISTVCAKWLRLSRSGFDDNVRGSSGCKSGRASVFVISTIIRFQMVGTETVRYGQRIIANIDAVRAAACGCKNMLDDLIIGVQIMYILK